jgi:hypothetical protein
MAIPTLIYCGMGNARLDQMAIDSGFKYGLRLPQRNSPNFPVYFSDQDWKSPKREKYMLSVKKYRPKIATILDFEKLEQYNEVMSWAEEISEIVDGIIIIPKFDGSIELLPKTINGKQVILGYSVPTKYGKTDLNLDLFDDWPVHLLGGSPHRQMEYTKNKKNIISIDCNYHAMMAINFRNYWTGKLNGEKRWWLGYQGEGEYTKEAYFRSFDISCKNIIRAWEIYGN